MAENWNFHGYVAVPLEEYSKALLGDDFKSADEIDNGQFVDAMLQILIGIYGNLEDVAEFVDACRLYAGACSQNIPKEVAETLFSDFKLFMKAKNQQNSNLLKEI